MRIGPDHERWSCSEERVLRDRSRQAGNYSVYAIRLANATYLKYARLKLTEMLVVKVAKTCVKAAMAIKARAVAFQF
jgi:hypothetical protein